LNDDDVECVLNVLILVGTEISTYTTATDTNQRSCLFCWYLKFEPSLEKDRHPVEKGLPWHEMM
jgi:hypothetical protein